MSEVEEFVQQWCQAIDGALKSDALVRTIRWYEQRDFDRDFGQTWAHAPVGE